MSGAVSAQYSVMCPICKALPFAPCRTLITRRVTDTHLARIDVAYNPSLGTTMKETEEVRGE